MQQRRSISQSLSTKELDFISQPLVPEKTLAADSSTKGNTRSSEDIL